MLWIWDVPYPSEVILTQPALSKNGERGISRDESCALCIPSPEDLVVLLPLLFAQRPRYLRSRSTLVLDVMLLDALLEVGNALVELRCTSEIRSGHVCRHERRGEHRHPWVGEPGGLSDEWALSTPSRSLSL